MSHAAEVSEYLRRHRRLWLPRVFPNGHAGNRYFELGDAKGAKGDSLKVPWSPNKGGLRDFGNCFAGDDLKLLMEGLGLDVAGAIRYAEDELGAPRRLMTDRPAPKAKTRPAAPQPEPPSEAAKPNGPAPHGHPRAAEPHEPTAEDWHWQGRDPVATFTYRDDRGRALYHVGRYESGATKKSGKAAKDYVPLSFDGRRWVHKRPTDPVLYNLPEIATHPAEGWLVFLEGEKKVDAARDLFERDLWRFTFTIWLGGPAQIPNQDLARAEGLGVIIAADGDDAGDKAALELAARLQGTASTVKVWRPPPEFRALKKGWDLADAADGLLPEGWDLDKIAYALQAAPTLAELRLRELGIVSAAELVTRELPEPRFIVPGYVTQGYNVVGGAPKMGKSWWVLGEAVGVADGASVMSGQPVEAGDVLYIALEDTERRLQDRLRAILQGRPAPARLDLVTRWRRMDDGGLDDLRLWLNAHADARLIVIDTLERFRGRRDRDVGIYGDDYAVGGAIKAIADQYGIALVLVHHLRKGESGDPIEMFSGSTGLTGAADTLLVLRRERGRADATLFVTGRDVEEVEKALQFDKDTGRWTLIGDAAEFRRSQEQNAILRTLATAEAPMTPKQIAEAVRKKPESVRFLLHKMRKAGLVSCDEQGRYSVSAGLDLNP